MTGNALSSQNSTAVADPAQTAGEILKILSPLKNVPGGDKLECLVNDFIEITEPGKYSSAESVENANSGLDDYSNHLLGSSPALKTEAAEFYQAAKTLVYDPKLAHGNYLVEHPQIGQSSGDADHASLKPGWLWNLALHYSHGNANRAMELIGICGNDDTLQGSFYVTLTPQEQEAAYEERKSVLDEVITRLQVKLKSDRSPNFTFSFCEFNPEPVDVLNNIVYPDLSTLENLSNCEEKKKIPQLILGLESYRDQLTPESLKKSRMSCPSGGVDTGQRYANFFLPKSLGAKVDISDAMRNRIDRTSDLRCSRSSTDPSSCIPAKYYHVLGSAFVACELISRGYDPHLVTELSKAAAWYYRVLTLSDTADWADSGATESNFGEELGKVAQGWVESLEEVRNFTKPKNDCPMPGATAPIQPTRAALSDALELMRFWSISGNFGANLGEVYTNLMLNPLASADLNWNWELSRPAHWTNARFKRAEAEVRSILTDFDWTIEQHKVGAEFAAQVCKPDPSQVRRTCRR